MSAYVPLKVHMYETVYILHVPFSVLYTVVSKHFNYGLSIVFVNIRVTLSTLLWGALLY
jgi:hypothetical protein